MIYLVHCISLYKQVNYMLSGDIIKAAGTITKEEELIAVEHNIMPNTLVLESSNPFPGYHGSNLPEDPLPGSIYLVTEARYEGEHILRIAKKVKKHLHEKCDSSFGQAQIYSGTYNFIRIRNLDCFSCIRRIQEAFSDEGIRFMKKKEVSGQALISINKFFSLGRIDENIYRDNDDPAMYYFEIDENPGWQLFKKTTIFIRGNVDHYSFDGALGTLYLEDITDIIRIFAKDTVNEQLHSIRKKYLWELSHPDRLE